GRDQRVGHIPGRDIHGGLVREQRQQERHHARADTLAIPVLPQRDLLVEVHHLDHALVGHDQGALADGRGAPLAVVDVEGQALVAGQHRALGRCWRLVAFGVGRADTTAAAGADQCVVLAHPVVQSVSSVGAASRIRGDSGAPSPISRMSAMAVAAKSSSGMEWTMRVGANSPNNFAWWLSASITCWDAFGSPAAMPAYIARITSRTMACWLAIRFSAGSRRMSRRPSVMSRAACSREMPSLSATCATEAPALRRRIAATRRSATAISRSTSV